MFTKAKLLATLSNEHVFDALPSDNGGLPARLTDYLDEGSVYPASQSDEIYLIRSEGGFSCDYWRPAFTIPGSLLVHSACIRPS